MIFMAISNNEVISTYQSLKEELIWPCLEGIQSYPRAPSHSKNQFSFVGKKKRSQAGWGDLGMTEKAQ